MPATVRGLQFAANGALTVPNLPVRSPGLVTPGSVVPETSPRSHGALEADGCFGIPGANTRDRPPTEASPPARTQKTSGSIPRRPTESCSSTPTSRRPGMLPVGLAVRDARRIHRVAVVRIPDVSGPTRKSRDESASVGDRSQSSHDTPEQTSRPLAEKLDPRRLAPFREDFVRLGHLDRKPVRVVEPSRERVGRCGPQDTGGDAAAARFEDLGDFASPRS